MTWERDYLGRIALPGSRPRLDPGAIVFVSLLAVAAVASPPCAPLAAPPPGVDQVEAAAAWLCRGAPRHPVSRDRAYRAQLAAALHRAAIATAVPPMLLTAIAYRESSFMLGAVGQLGELGLGQVHTAARRACDRENINLSTAEGQALCAARWLALSRDRCGGSLEAGITLYATGRTCRPDREAVRRVVADRVRLWRQLENLFSHKETT